MQTTHDYLSGEKIKLSDISVNVVSDTLRNILRFENETKQYPWELCGTL